MLPGTRGLPGLNPPPARSAALVSPGGVCSGRRCPNGPRRAAMAAAARPPRLARPLPQPPVSNGQRRRGQGTGRGRGFVPAAQLRSARLGPPLPSPRSRLPPGARRLRHAPASRSAPLPARPSQPPGPKRSARPAWRRDPPPGRETAAGRRGARRRLCAVPPSGHCSLPAAQREGPVTASGTPRGRSRGGLQRRSRRPGTAPRGPSGWEGGREGRCCPAAAVPESRGGGGCGSGGSAPAPAPARHLPGAEGCSSHTPGSFAGCGIRPTSSFH